MTTLQSGTFKVFTYKAGLLARLAHDLRLTLGRFEVNIDGEEVRGRFWPASLSVDGAVKNGAVDSSTPGESDTQKIHENITAKILHTDRFPEVTFDGTGDPATGRVRGALTMHGQTQPIELTVKASGGRYTGALDLVPTRWGIPPFKAVGGAIKLQDRVRIEFELS